MFCQSLSPCLTDVTLACEDSRILSISHGTSHSLTSCFDSHVVHFFKLYWAFCQSMSLDSFIHPVTRIKSYDLFWHLFIWSFTCIPQRAYICIHMHIYIYQAANPLICPFNLIWWLLSDGFCAFESNNQSELPSRLDWLFPVVFVFSLVLGFVCFCIFDLVSADVQIQLLKIHNAL